MSMDKSFIAESLVEAVRLEQEASRKDLLTRTWYLGGPMSGYENFNFPAFEVAAAGLRNLGLTIVSAHEVDHGEHTGAGTQMYQEYLRGDLGALLQCEGD